MARQDYIVHVSSSEMKKLLEVQQQALGTLESMRTTLEKAQEHAIVTAERVEQSDDRSTRLQEESNDLAKDLLKTSEKSLEQREKELEAITQMSESVKTFDNFADKFDNFTDKLKTSLDPSNLKETMLKKFNFGGVFDKKIEEGKFIKQQKALGSEKSDKELKADFEERNTAAKAIKKNEAKINSLKESTGLSEEQLKNAPPESAAGKLFAERAQLAKRVEKTDIRSSYVNNNPEKSNTEKVKESEVITKTATAAEPVKIAEVIKPIPVTFATPDTAEQNKQLNVSEDEMEAARMQEDHLDVLKQIEKNTRTGVTPGASPATSSGGGGLMGGIGSGLKSLGGGLAGLGKGIGKGVEGLLKGIAEGIKSFGNSDVLKGAATMTILATALWITGKAVQEFVEVEWEDMAKAGVALLGLAGVAKLMSAGSTEMIKGAAAIAVLGGALWVAGKGFEVFGEMDWSAIGKGFVALLGLGAVAAVLGLALPFIIPGAIAIAALGAALIPFGIAFNLAGPAMESFAKAMTSLSELDGSNLLKVGPALLAIAAGMTAMGAAQAAAGVGNLVGKFLSFVSGQKTPVEQIIELGKNGNDIAAAGSGVEGIGKGLMSLSQVDADKIKAIAALPTEKIAAMGAAMRSAAPVYDQSAQNAGAAIPTQGGAQVIAPVQNNVSVNQNQNQIIKSPVRNQDGTVGDYLKSRYA